MAVHIMPSMPLAPRLAWTVTSGRGVAYHSRSRTGIDDATTRWAPAGSVARSARAVPGSVGSGWSASTAAMAASAAASSSSHRSSQPGSGSGSEVDPTAATVCDGSSQRRSAISVAPVAGEPFVHDPGGRWWPDAHDDVRAELVGQRRHPQQRRRRGGRRRSPERGSASTGTPSGTSTRRRPATTSGRPHPVELECQRRVSATLALENGASGSARPGEGRRARRPAARGTAGSGGRDRCGGLGDGTAAEAPPRAARRLVGDAGVVEPPHGPPVEVGLVDRLGGADVAQLRAAGRRCTTSSGTPAWWASTTAAWKWVAAVPLVHRTTAGVGTRPCRQPEPERHERGAALVVVDVHVRSARRRAAPAPSASTGSRGRRTAWRPRRGPTRRRGWRRTSAWVVAGSGIGPSCRSGGCCTPR